METATETRVNCNSRVLSMEESVRESNQRSVELENQLKLLAEENTILEEKNKALASQQVCVAYLAQERFV